MADPAAIMLCCHAFPAFSETFVVEHAVLLASAGHQVTVCATEVDQPAVQALNRSRGVNLRAADIDRSMADRGGIGRTMWLMRRLGWRYRARTRHLTGRERVAAASLLEVFAAQSRPTIVHAHFGPMAVQAAVAARICGLPLIAEFHGYDVTSHVAKHGWDAYREHLRDATLVVHSQFVGGLVREHLGRECTLVPFGVDTSRFESPARASSWPVPLKLLVVGRLMPQKGQEVALQALARLDPALDARLTVVGDGDSRRSLEQLASELGIAGRVTFTGSIPHPEVARIMAASDMLLVPSRTSAKGWKEAFCLVALEGMATGMTVVATDCGGLGETVGTGGVVVAENNPAALAAGVASAIQQGTPEYWQKRALAKAASYPIAAMRKAYLALASRIA